MMDRTSFEALLESEGPYCIRNRDTGEPIELSREDYDDLVRLRLCDWLEQVARSNRWDYRRDAIRLMAQRLGGVGGGVVSAGVRERAGGYRVVRFW